MVADRGADKDIRDQALTSLRTFLSGRSEISDLDLLKLWKGLFYCMILLQFPSLSLLSIPLTLRC